MHNVKMGGAQGKPIDTESRKRSILPTNQIALFQSSYFLRDNKINLNARNISNADKIMKAS